MSHSGDVWTLHTEIGPWKKILINLPSVLFWWKLVLASRGGAYGGFQKSSRWIPYCCYYLPRLQQGGIAFFDSYELHVVYKAK